MKINMKPVLPTEGAFFDINNKILLFSTFTLETLHKVDELLEENNKDLLKEIMRSKPRKGKKITIDGIEFICNPKSVMYEFFKENHKFDYYFEQVSEKFDCETDIWFEEVK